MINMAYWGSGPISNFHIPALKKAGFNIVCAYSRENSDRLEKFCFEHKINKSENESKFFQSIQSSCDCIMISLETSITPEHIKKVLHFEKPILCEKPGALCSSDLSFIPNKTNIFFAYNRTYYNTVEAAKKFIENKKSTNTTIFMPDSISTWHQFLINGCHMIDLMLYLYDFDLKHICSIGNLKNDGSGFQSIFKSRNHLISFIENWGTPQNALINISSNGERIELKPIEKAFIYKSMERIEPTDDYPLRQYIPKVDSSFQTDLKEFKPGFLEQSINFFNFVKTSKYNPKMCTLNQAVNVLQTMEKIKSNLS